MSFYFDQFISYYFYIIFNDLLFLLLYFIYILYFIYFLSNLSYFRSSPYLTFIKKRDNIIKIFFSNTPIKKNHYLTFLFLFFIIFTFNFFGFVIYGFPLTTHIYFNLFLSFTVYIISLFQGLFTHKFNFFRSFLPFGAPILLAPFIIGIELVSNIFKPISLGFRLTANITAGHILLTIITDFLNIIFNFNSIFSFLYVYAIFLILVFIIILELAVLIIQSYVFLLLSIIYISDSIILH